MIDIKRIRFHIFLILAVISLVIAIFPFFGNYNVAYYRQLLDFFSIPELVYVGWIILATATTMPISAAMVAGIIFFSFAKAMVLTVFGVIIGAVGTYYLSIILGKGFVEEDYNIKGKTKMHIFNELMHEHSVAYCILLAAVYIFPSNLAYMIAGLTGLSLMQLLLIVFLGNITTVFATGLILFGLINSNMTHSIIGFVLLIIINIIPVIFYYKEMKKLILLFYNRKAYERLVKIEKIEKEIAKDIRKSEGKDED